MVAPMMYYGSEIWAFKTSGVYWKCSVIFL